MPNEVQLLVSTDVSGMARAMLESAESMYRGYHGARFERNHRQSGGKLTFTVLRDERLLPDCHRFIEAAPVRAGLVQSPGQYPWSAYSQHAFGGAKHHLALHDSCKRLFSGDASRFSNYREFIRLPFTETQLRFMKNRLQSSFPVRRRLAGTHSLCSTPGRRSRASPAGHRVNQSELA